MDSGIGARWQGLEPPDSWGLRRACPPAPHPELQAGCAVALWASTLKTFNG